jgi:tetratricopeptide (TPR) repeat protein
MMHDGSNANQHSLKVSDFDKDLIVIIMSNDSRKTTPFELNSYVLNLSKYNTTQIPQSWWFAKEIKRVGFDTTLVNYRKTLHNSNQLIKDEFSFWVYGYIMMLKGELDNAIEILKINMENFPESADTYDSYAELLIQAKRFKEAKPVIKEGLKLAKKSNNPNLTLSLTDKWEANFK